MNERCWCGKTLEAHAMSTMSQPRLVCPVHGENWRLGQERVIALVAAVRAVAYILESRDKPTGHGPAADAELRRSDEHIGAFIRKHEGVFTKALKLLPKENGHD